MKDKKKTPLYIEKNYFEPTEQLLVTWRYFYKNLKNVPVLWVL